MRIFALFTLVFIFCPSLFAQDLFQTIRGTILDKESKTPLIGAYVEISDSEPLLGTSSDLAGEWRIDNVPIGRQSSVITYIGYELVVIPHIAVTTGKEIVLQIEMEESTVQLDELTITAEKTSDRAQNEMAVLSSKSISVDETKRYAASFLDPARMAQNFAGVTQTGDDLSNEIVVRGNSPQYVTYRLEGIEIPNPNHFSDVGASGGAISILSSSTLGVSDFYTGAFPSEFWNAVIVNAQNIYPIVYGTEGLVSDGKARNYGLDLSVNRSFQNHYYWMVTGSIFQSEFQDHKEDWYSTRWNSNFNLTILGGKEFVMGPSRKNTLGVNGKLMFMGGNRYNPVDREASQAASEVITTGDWFSGQVKNYFRSDLSLNYTVNREKLSHQISIQIQNVSNRSNIADIEYNLETDSFEEYNMTGLFPIFNYRVEF